MMDGWINLEVHACTVHRFPTGIQSDVRPSIDRDTSTHLQYCTYSTVQSIVVTVLDLKRSLVPSRAFVRRQLMGGTLRCIVHTSLDFGILGALYIINYYISPSTA